MNKLSGKGVKKIVKDKYSSIASRGCGCCGDSESLGYSVKDLSLVPEADMGLGCGNPNAFAHVKSGDVVLDLGSGAGIDCFIAAKKVGSTGRVIGVDMTEEMIKKAKEHAKKYGFSNVEFRLGDIEALPVDSGSVDVVISNCVINLSPDKLKVFREAYRVLKKNGRLCVSDIVLLKELSEEQRRDPELIAGCVGGAVLKDEYLRLIRKAGFSIRIDSEDKKISKTQYKGIPLESIKIIATKK